VSLAYVDQGRELNAGGNTKYQAVSGGVDAIHVGNREINHGRI